MNVLFLNHCLGYGGATKSLILMQKALKEKVNIFTIIPKQKNLILAIKNEFKYSKEFIEIALPLVYSYFDNTISNRKFEKNTKFFPRILIDYIIAKQIDILHINSSLFAHFNKPIKENTKCKIVTHIREMLPNGINHNVDKYIIDNIVEYSDAIIAISDNEIIHFSQGHNRHIIPNPHDFSLTDNLSNSRKRNQNKCIIGMCAAFLRTKGHINFLEAAKIINNETNSSRIDIEFRIIGYPQVPTSLKVVSKRILRYGYLSNFDRKLRKLELDNITLIPYTLDIYDYLADFNIYVRPDISGNPWGRDIIEAMAMKLPIVATGTSEFLVKNNWSGFLVPINQPEKLAENILLLIKNRELCEQMGNRGYESIREKCDLEKYGEKILDVYDRL